MESPEIEADNRALAEPFDPRIDGSWIEGVFNGSLVGIVHTDSAGNVLYSNPKANEICGYPDLRAKSLDQLFCDSESRERIQHQLASRHQGLSDEYEINVTRGDGRTIPISISSMPVMTGLSEPRGAISIVRSLELEKSELSLDRVVSSATNIGDLLRGIAESLNQTIPFDLFRVSFFSEDQQHVRIAYEYPPGRAGYSARWSAIPDNLRDVATGRRPSRHSLRDLSKLNSDMVAALLQEGYLWSMRRPVYRQDRLAGSVAVLTKNPMGFSDGEFEVFRKMALEKALVAALFFASEEDLEFTIRLAKSISACKTENEMFDRLTKDLAEKHEWSHVAVFVPDEIDRRLVLQSQASIGGGAKLPKNYTQPLTVGVIGNVFRTGEDARSPNVLQDPKFSAIVFQPPELRGSRSELCMRITDGEKTFALLNIEDFRENAFALEQEKTLRHLLNELGAMIKSLETSQFMAEAVRITPTALFLLDARGIIRFTNPAAQSVLEISEEESTGNSIEKYIADPPIARSVATATHPNGEIELIGKRGKRTTGMLAGLPLTGNSERRLITFRDITIQKKARELESLNEIYSDLARRIRPALAMIGGAVADMEELRTRPWGNVLLRALQGTPSPIEKELPQSLHVILAHLRQIESALDQATFVTADRDFDAAPATIPVAKFVDDLRSYLPGAASDDAQEDIPPCIGIENTATGHVRADPGQLTLVIETILGDLLRFRKPKGIVHLQVSESDSLIHFRFSGNYPERGKVAYEGLSDILQAKASEEMSRGEARLRKVIERLHGVFQAPARVNGQITIEFDLPAVKGTAQ